MVGAKTGIAVLYVCKSGGVVKKSVELKVELGSSELSPLL